MNIVINKIDRFTGRTKEIKASSMKEVDYYMERETDERIVWREEPWGNWVEIGSNRYEIKYKE